MDRNNLKRRCVFCTLCFLGIALFILFSHSIRIFYADRGNTTIAASDSQNKKQAGYVCDGTADNVKIQSVIDAFPSSGGKVQLLDGRYITKAAIKLTLQR